MKRIGEGGRVYCFAVALAAFGAFFLSFPAEGAAAEGSS